MACLSKITSDVLFDCANFSNVGGIPGVDEIVILNSEDITAIAVDASNVATVTMKSATKGFVVSGIKNSIQYTDAIRSSDTAPNMEEHSLAIKLASTNITDAAPYRDYISKMLKGNFRVAIKSKATGRYFLAGTYCGLEASDLATDSATDGITTVTLKTPDGATGDTLTGITEASYNALKTAA